MEWEEEAQNVIEATFWRGCPLRVNICAEAPFGLIWTACEADRVGFAKP